MKENMKKVAKFTGAACTATGMVVLSSLVASGAAVGAIVEGFKSAASTMKKVLAEETKEEQVQAEQFKLEQIAKEAIVTEPVTELSAENCEAVTN